MKNEGRRRRKTEKGKEKRRERESVMRNRNVIGMELFYSTCLLP